MNDNSKKSLDDVMKLIGKQHVAMLTTLDGDQLVSRPMGAQEPDADGTLWFFTEAGSEKAQQIEADGRVNVTYADGDYVSVEGTAEVVHDPAKQRELWNPFAESWLQCEAEDPKVALIKVNAHTIGYWDTPSTAGSMISMVKGLITNTQPDGGDSGVVDADAQS
ncbi:MAG: pyridoxamine 5'-phosphate oxidase family protein [Propionibacteriaceae bacterium]|nr:pyridoxamine 5'-phosphate oxidase family protein [Propionibacteriaceae bacterium]